MAMQIATSSVVVAAQHFNPSITGQHWLIENNIVLPEEFQVGAIFTDMFVQIPTRDFHLQVIPESCQFTIAPHVGSDAQRKLIKERLGKLVSTLPHTPYTGVGLNFTWHFFPDNETIGDACRRLFFLGDKPIHNLFDASDARFGAYMSRAWKRFRLRLDVRPILLTLPGGQQNETIQFNFNYHCGVAGRPEPSRDILNAVEEWNSARDDSTSIVETAITKGQLP